MQEARTVVKGSRVRVVAGRKVARGTEGLVVWIGNGRIGFNIDGSTDPTWIDLKNIERVDDIDFPTLAELRAEYLAL